MDKFKECVKGFADSLEIIRNLFPERKKDKKKFSVVALATDYLSNENLDSLHNAVDDVNILKKLVDKIGVTDEIVLKNTKTFNQIAVEQQNKVLEILNKVSLEHYKENLSVSMISKMAKSGINKCILEEAYKKSGEQGIRLLLGENIDGKPRVTTNKKVLQQVYQMLINV